ncbi:MAG: hypothetical protein LCH53_06150 [Bacteroidetes bacterium]|nr:hypothetical protein [Bacteroidota bacterium]
MADDQNKDKPSTTPKKTRYTALSPINFNKKPYELGDTLTLTDEEAAPLIAVAAIEEAK